MYQRLGSLRRTGTGKREVGSAGNRPRFFVLATPTSKRSHGGKRGKGTKENKDAAGGTERGIFVRSRPPLCRRGVGGTVSAGWVM